MIGAFRFAKTLYDLGASINLIPLSIYKQLGLGTPKPISMSLLMADRSMKRPIGILYDVLVKVDKFIFHIDFVILNCKVDFEVPIFLYRPFYQPRECSLIWSGMIYNSSSMMKKLISIFVNL